MFFFLRVSGMLEKKCFLSVSGMLEKKCFFCLCQVCFIVGEPEIQKLEKSGRKVAEF